MSGAKARTGGSSEIRARLAHPVIDGDGHLVEIGPVLLDFLKEEGGTGVVDRYTKAISKKGGAFYLWYRLTPEERKRQRVIRPPFWVVTAGRTVDRATSMMPALLSERLDEFGIDFSLLYPTEGLIAPTLDDEEVRRATARAINRMNAELFAPHSARLAPAAIIPMHTPEEAIAELDFAIGELGMKVAMITGSIRRPYPDSDDSRAYWIDALALDGAHDYDPVWQKCIDLGVAATEHNGALGLVNRASVSNYNYNHLGHFAAGSETFCKALFLGGVTRRFPALKFGFLECGVGWAASLYNDLIGHWEKRNLGALKANLDPALVDRAAFADLIVRYGDERVRAKLEYLRERDGIFLDQVAENEDELDEWAACAIERAQDIHDLFVPNFYFGCEADDPMTAVAFNARVNRFGARLKAIMSSDIGHWDVPDARAVLVEAWELVEDGVLSEADFRDFTFANPAELHSTMNPDFFAGTAVADAVAKLRAEAPGGLCAATQQGETRGKTEPA